LTTDTVSNDPFPFNRGNRLSGRCLPVSSGTIASSSHSFRSNCPFRTNPARRSPIPTNSPLRPVRNKSTHATLSTLLVLFSDRLRRNFVMSATVTALAITLAIVLVLAIVIISLLYVRMRRNPTDNRGSVGLFSSKTPIIGSFFVASPHPTAQISPFDPSHQRPIFHHEPGKNMRVAQRRGDGGWEFYDSGLPGDEPLPRPPESVHSGDDGSSIPPAARSTSSVWTQSYPLLKAQEVKAHANYPGLVAPPPPAYTIEDSVSTHSQL